VPNSSANKTLVRSPTYLELFPSSKGDR
jgi:hypothetical protein